MAQLFWYVVHGVIRVILKEAYMLKFSLSCLCCVKEETDNRIKILRKLGKHELCFREQNDGAPSESVSLILCFACASSPCFSLWQDALYNAVCFRGILHPWCRRTAYSLIEDLYDWQHYCQTSDVTLYLFLRPVQYPLNHKTVASTNKQIDGVDRRTDA